MSFANGQLPQSMLARVPATHGTAYMRKDAAARFNAHNASRTAVGSSVVMVNGPLSGYRNFPGQVLMRSQWCAVGKCGNAAVPGTSNHGWGIAGDVNNPSELQRTGPRYGWDKRTSDAPHEPWHFKWNGTGPAVFVPLTIEGRLRLRPIRKGDKSGDVRTVQVYLKRGGYLPKDARVAKRIGTYGPRSVAAVKRFQRSVGLTPDGVVGPRTLAELKQRWGRAALLRRRKSN